MPTDLSQLADGDERTKAPKSQDPFAAALQASREAKAQAARAKTDDFLAGQRAKAQRLAAQLEARALQTPEQVQGPAAAPPVLPVPAPLSEPLRKLVEAANVAQAALENAPAEQYTRVSVGVADPLEADRDAARDHDAAQAELEKAYADLGGWSKDGASRLAACMPDDDDDDGLELAVHVGREVYAVSRLATIGSHQDLAYAIGCMLRMMRGRVEVLGAYVVHAMGLGVDGHCERQLWSTKARRQLVRSFVLFMCSQVRRLVDIEPRAKAQAERPVRAVKKVPQAFFARICRRGTKPWSRSTTARDASSACKWGLWTRRRLTTELAPADERAGESGQVVSRYSSWIPSLGGRSAAHAAKTLGELAGKLAEGGAEREALFAWVRGIGQHAVRFAVGEVPQLAALRWAGLPHVPGLLEPPWGALEPLPP